VLAKEIKHEQEAYEQEEVVAQGALPAVLLRVAVWRCLLAAHAAELHSTESLQPHTLACRVLTHTCNL
jgi:hypothetical protein